MCICRAQLHLAPFCYALMRVFKDQLAILAQHGKGMRGSYTPHPPPPPPNHPTHSPPALNPPNLKSHTTALLCPCRPADGSPSTTVAQSSETVHETTILTQHVAQDALLRPDVFLVITAKCIWPIASFWQQKQLCELAKDFCYTELGVHGPVIQVYGDMLPPSDFLIIVPRAREVPDMIRAASEFIHACHKLWALSVRLQLGQSAVFDTSGILLHHVAVLANCPK